MKNTTLPEGERVIVVREVGAVFGVKLMTSGAVPRDEMWVGRESAGRFIREAQLALSGEASSGVQG